VRRTNPATWLLLIHRIPATPDYLRVKFRRALGQSGAVAIKNSVYVLPATAAAHAAMAGLARDILRAGGEAVVCEGRLVEGLTDGAVEDMLRTARAAEYAAIAAEARRLAAGLLGRRGRIESHRRRTGQALARLNARFDHAVARDGLAAPGREGAAGMLSLLEDRVQGVEESPARTLVPPEPPRGATWVTRAAIMVDRIASAWLIRRFIDPAASFRFVAGRGYRARPGEIRFDMAGAEYTHAGGRCTFEVLIERFGLLDAALAPIAEIVHDLDLEDGRYQRPETAGVDRMIVGLALAKLPDEVRLAQGATLFESLYASFRRQDRHPESRRTAP
jgi:hypothetical protein